MKRNICLRRNDKRVIIWPLLPILPFSPESIISTIKSAGCEKTIYSSAVAATATALCTPSRFSSQIGEDIDQERTTDDKQAA